MADLIIQLTEPGPKPKTHCRRGHEFLPGSFKFRCITVKGKPYKVRECRACINLRNRQYKKLARTEK